MTINYIDVALQASFSGAPLEEGKARLLDIHEGFYGHNASSRSLVRKAF
jgi:hypothetical protein